MIYSKTCEYALRALSYLASKKDQTYCLIPEISRETGISQSYIAKIFQSLVRDGILTSQRGPAGGFQLKKDPSEYTLFDVIRNIDHVSLFDRDCVMGLDACSAANACPLHFVWASAKKKIEDQLKRTTLRDMKKKMNRLEFRKLNRSRLRMTHLHKPRIIFS